VTGDSRPRPELLDCLDSDDAIISSLRELRVLLVYRKVDAGFGLMEQARKDLLGDMPLPGDSGWIAALARNHFDPVDAFLEEVGSRSGRMDRVPHWQRNEWLLNVRMNLFFAFQAPERTAACAVRMVPGAGALSPMLKTVCANCDRKEIKSAYGFADVLLRSPELLLMIEMKARGQMGPGMKSNPSSQPLSREQVLRYSRLAVDAHPAAGRSVLLVCAPDDEASQRVLGAGLELAPERCVSASDEESMACSRVLVQDACEYVAVDGRTVDLAKLEVWKSTYEEIARTMAGVGRTAGPGDDRARLQLDKLVRYARIPEGASPDAP
jgi:hypothetical protein